MTIIFEWNHDKYELNLKKHGLSFEHAKLLFNQYMVVNIDNRFDYKEKRVVGYAELDGRLMCVVYTEPKPNRIRLISFRKANHREKEYYKKTCFK